VPAQASPIVPGARIGELTVERLYGRRSGARLWTCRCDCGSAVVRSTGELLRYRRLGQTPCCRRCFEELRAGRSLARRRELCRFFADLWESERTLYTEATLERIEEDIREQVGQRLGGWRDDADAPASLCIDPTWCERPRRRLDDAPEVEAEHEDHAAAPPVATVDERRTRALDAALARARSPRPLPQEARGPWLAWFASAAP
jgi:hypothetical protein